MDVETLKDLGGFESFVYEYQFEEKEYILRVGHGLRRNRMLVRGELDWLDFLSRNGADVSTPRKSAAGNLVEAVSDEHGDEFLATSFRKAPGRPPERADWKEELFLNYGETIGRLHALSREYKPKAGFERLDWDHPMMLNTADSLPETEPLALEKLKQTRETLQSYPQNPDTYGLIHQDAHAGNFYLTNEGKITLFDFDDCCYGHFAYDVAMVLFYAVTWSEDPDQFAPKFLTPFLQGYTRHSKFEKEWLEWLPAFLKLREIDLYGVIHRDRDVENLTSPWEINFMNGRKERIESGRPYINFPFGKLQF